MIFAQISLVVSMFLFAMYDFIRPNTYPSIDVTCSIGEKVSPSVPERPLVLFQTSQRYNGNLGGIEGADKICDKHKPGSSGVAYALLTSKSRSADSVFSLPELIGIRLTTDVCASGAMDAKMLFGSSLRMGIDGVSWTGGSKGNCVDTAKSVDCNGWTSSDPDVDGFYGWVSNRGFCTSTHKYSCDSGMTLLCVYVPAEEAL